MKKAYQKWSSKLSAILMTPLLLVLFAQMAQAQNKRYNITGEITDASSKAQFREWWLKF